MTQPPTSSPLLSVLLPDQKRLEHTPTPRHWSGFLSSLEAARGVTASAAARGSPPRSSSSSQKWRWWVWWLQAGPWSRWSHLHRGRRPGMWDNKMRCKKSAQEFSLLNCSKINTFLSKISTSHPNIIQWKLDIEIWFNKIPDITNKFVQSQWFNFLCFVLFNDYWFNKISDITN